ncbi:ESX secretion-associated protein EspG [Nocardia stercoris]|uniref:ESX secretion-associated protein EspG n=1 Tax=Nocardia stercoris TaxID=2483361 RepID=A0A3M2LC03_9NOCA|nr:ESX secretion-associated protein EspG [Nocardia stercoris]RMI35072.1 ESX secretion-associated protein EspG [Nocardia stercoris]
MAEWSWETDDFAAFWYSDANDRFPYPIAYTSRFATADAAAAHRAAVRARYDADQTELIQLAMDTVTASDVHIEIVGSSTTFGNGSPREYRMLGARTMSHAVLLTQAADDGVHGAIRCRLFPSEQLGRRLGDVLPAAKPGSGRTETFHLADLQPDAPDSRAAQRFEQLGRRRFDGSGQAALYTGNIHARPDAWFETRWVDVTGDGRYLQQLNGEHLTLRPVSAGDLATGFDSWIARALDRLRADEPDTW